MKINIALIILFSQIHFMGASAQKVTYIHFIHGPLMGNKENDYVAIEMSLKVKILYSMKQEKNINESHKTCILDTSIHWKRIPL